MKKCVIVVAGGKGLRMGGDLPKQFMPVCGKPVLMHTIQAFYDYDTQIRIILVLPENQIAYWRQLCETQPFSIPHQLVKGGETRFHSVKNGLMEVGENTLVGIHDGVRPLVSQEIIAKAYQIAKNEKAAFPAISVTDSIRERDNEWGESHAVDRSKYFLVQTPQVFLSDILSDAYSQDYQESFTDDVSVVEATRVCRPVMFEGSKENIKITTPIDLIIAKHLMKCRI
ncbi:2-C-methyl-D-erythritol 4-phosphate cytidylyltransferase [Bacteroidia bacterium]|nr:2-C-methyl-D-erythritol 4-phosphate cytidylyltransferase [Bacteroidia bacterium]